MPKLGLFGVEKRRSRAGPGKHYLCHDHLYELSCCPSFPESCFAVIVSDSVGGRYCSRSSYAFDTDLVRIDKFGGIVIEFIGDAIYAVFGAPVRNREHRRGTTFSFPLLLNL